jgi:hypothetical protein
VGKQAWRPSFPGETWVKLCIRRYGSNRAGTLLLMHTEKFRNMALNNLQLLTGV